MTTYPCFETGRISLPPASPTAGQAIADDDDAEHMTIPGNVDALEGDTCGERTTSGWDNEKWTMIDADGESILGEVDSGFGHPEKHSMACSESSGYPRCD